MSDPGQETRAPVYKAPLSVLAPVAIGEMYEGLTTALYTRCLSDGQVTFDCGANVGRHAVPMAYAVAPGGKVHAFEHSTPVLRALKKGR